MCGLLLLFCCLLLLAQFVDKQLHTLRVEIRKRIFAAKIQIVPEPLFIILVAGLWDSPFSQDGLIKR